MPAPILRIQRSPNGSSGWADLTTVADGVEDYTDTGRTPGVPYFYRIREEWGSAFSEWSAVVNATTQLDAPSGLTATASDVETVNLAWVDNSVAADTFQIQISLDNSIWTDLDTVASGVEAYESDGLADGTLYYCRVRAELGALFSNWSSTASATTFVNGVRLLIVNPTGITDTNYSPATEHGALLFNATGNGALTSATTFDLDTDGYAQDTNTYAVFADLASIPAYTTRRKYELWGKTKDASLTNNIGVEIITNRAAGSTVTYWSFIMIYATATGRFDLYLAELVAGVYNLRASTFTTVAPDWPGIWHLTVYEQGDSVVFQATMYESDATGDDEAVSCSYSIANRPQKSVTRATFRTVNSSADEWLIRGCMISDMI